MHDNEKNKVFTYFNPEKRSTPKPFYPENDKIFEYDKIQYYLKKANPENQISIYIHIPVCDRKCTFCDLYSFHIDSKKYPSFIENYFRALSDEIHLWSCLLDLKKFKISTIHLGGGSPMCIPENFLIKLFDLLNYYFNLSSKPEIAVEITTSEITPKNIDFFDSHSIKRIHLGIQTLNDKFRNILGRKELSSDIKKKLNLLISNERIISADVLYGLPLQSMTDFKMEIEEFSSLGFDGFALYELQINNKMNKVVRANKYPLASSTEKFEMFLYAKNFLNSRGFNNVFFNHLGNERDRNLYFTYPIRNEDCLSFGTIADGKIGNVFYRHQKVKQYMNSISENGLGIEFIYLEDDLRTDARKLEEQLMSSVISEDMVTLCSEKLGESFRGIFDLWKIAGMIQKRDHNPFYDLTGAGCWFLSDMINQVRRLKRQSQS